jgi:hypothetical protein
MTARFEDEGLGRPEWSRVQQAVPGVLQGLVQHGQCDEQLRASAVAPLVALVVKEGAGREEQRGAAQLLAALGVSGPGGGGAWGCCWGCEGAAGACCCCWRWWWWGTGPGGIGAGAAASSRGKQPQQQPGCR